MKKIHDVTFPAWAPFALIFLSFWLFVAPATFGYLSSPLGASDRICGLLIFLLALILRRNPKQFLLWTVGLIGVWLQFAPLLLRISSSAGYLNDTLIGVLAIFFSVILATPKESHGRHIPNGWSYNPSSYAQRLPVIFLTGVGWFIARYLTAYQLGFISTMWDPFFGNGTVEVITSTISKTLPVPDAGLGAFAYTLEFLLGCHGSSVRWRTSPWLVLSFGILVVPVGLISILLITLQPLMVHAWCTLCLGTALVMLIMITLTVDEVAASLQMLRQGKKQGLSVWSLLWHGWPDEKEIPDHKTVHLNASFKKLFKACFLGCGLPWNLVIATLLGAVVMTLPAIQKFEGALADTDHVFGALIVVFSIISMAEIVRKLRYLLWFFTIAIATIALMSTTGWPLIIHLVIAVALIFLAKRKGKISNSYIEND